jgi:integrase
MGRYRFQARELLIVKTKIKKQRLPHMPRAGSWWRSPICRAMATSRSAAGRKAPCAGSGMRISRRPPKAVPGFKRLTFHSCRHGFATTTLRVMKLDPKTASELGGWDDITLFMRTYAHAIKDATLTETIFDTPLTQPKTKSKKTKRLPQ